MFALQGKNYAGNKVALDLYVDAIKDQLRGFVNGMTRLVPEMIVSTKRAIPKQFVRDALLAALETAPRQWFEWKRIACHCTSTTNRQ